MSNDVYNADKLYERLVAVMKDRYPNFRSLRLIVSSEPGGGKSVLLGSMPVPSGKKRVILDSEDSMGYLDSGPEGHDVYTPRRQTFRMSRLVYPDLATYASVFQAIEKNPEEVGAFGIDNIAVFQDILVAFLAENALNPTVIRVMYRKFGCEQALPVDGLIRKVWPTNQDGTFWRAVKEIPKRLLLMLSRNGINFIGTTEEGNVWVNYGKPDAKIIGKKAKIWDVWYRYSDGVISLKRDVNSTNPPHGMLYPDQPKMRLQGLNPRFVMDWGGFIMELEEASKRTEAEIPEEARIVVQEVYEEQ